MYTYTGTSSKDIKEEYKDQRKNNDVENLITFSEEKKEFHNEKNQI
jgi:hypothetical protein